MVSSHERRAAVVPRKERLPTGRQPLVVFLVPVYIGFNICVFPQKRLGLLFSVLWVENERSCPGRTAPPRPAPPSPPRPASPRLARVMSGFCVRQVETSGGGLPAQPQQQQDIQVATDQLLNDR